MIRIGRRLSYWDQAMSITSNKNNDREWVEIPAETTGGSPIKNYRLYIGGESTETFKYVYRNWNATAAGDIEIIKGEGGSNL